MREGAVTMREGEGMKRYQLEGTTLEIEAGGKERADILAPVIRECEAWLNFVQTAQCPEGSVSPKKDAQSAEICYNK
jgi:hypothetical protein